MFRLQLTWQWRKNGLWSIFPTGFSIPSLLKVWALDQVSCELVRKVEPGPTFWIRSSRGWVLQQTCKVGSRHLPLSAADLAAWPTGEECEKAGALRVQHPRPGNPQAPSLCLFLASFPWLQKAISLAAQSELQSLAPARYILLSALPLAALLPCTSTYFSLQVHTHVQDSPVRKQPQHA